MQEVQILGRVARINGFNDKFIVFGRDGSDYQLYISYVDWENKKASATWVTSDNYGGYNDFTLCENSGSKFITLGKRLFSSANGTSVSKWNISSPPLISYSDNYMYYAGKIYSIPISSDWNTINNNKTEIGTVNCTNNQITFDKDNIHIYSVYNNNLYIYKIENNKIVQEDERLLDNISMKYLLNTPFCVVSNESSTNYIYASVEDIITSIERDGYRYVSIDAKNVPKSSEVLEGTSYVGLNGINKSGTMPNNGELTYTPSTEQQTIPEGYTSGGTIAGDTNLLPENIKQNVTIFGVAGVLGEAGLDSSDATATVNDVLSPKTFYAGNEKQTGAIIPSYKTTEATNYLSTATDLLYASTEANKQIIQLENYTFYMFYTGGSITIRAIVDNKVEASSTYTLTELFNDTHFNNTVLTYDTFTADDNFVLDVGKGYNNGNGSTALHFRRVKYYVKTKSFRLMDGIATGSGWGDTGNNYGFGAVGSSVLPNRFVVQYSYWRDNISQAFGKIQWSDTTGSVVSLTTSSRSDGFNYGIRETGNGHVYTTSDRLYLVNDAESSISKIDTSTFAYVSHNHNYMVYNKCLYELTNGLNVSSATDLFNNKTLLKDNLPTYNYVFFSKNDTYVLLVSSTNIYVISLIEDDHAITQTITGKTYMFPYNAQCFYNLNESYYDKYEYTSGEELISLERSGEVFSKIEEKNVPTTDKVLAGNKYIGVSGVQVGTMPNLGKLEITPSASVQELNEGYITGGIINAAKIANSDEYIDCLEYANCILNHTTKLPYKNLPYIQTDGNQWIATGLDASSDLDVEIKFKTLRVTQAYGRVIGTTIDCNYEFCDMKNISSYRFSINNGKIKNNIPVDNSNFNTAKIIGTGKLYINNQLITDLASSPASSPVQLFTCMSGQEGGILQVEYCKMWKANELVRNYVPASDNNGTVCLYDKVTKEYYYNQGTGSFIGGAEV